MRTPAKNRSRSMGDVAGEPAQSPTLAPSDLVQVSNWSDPSNIDFGGTTSWSIAMPAVVAAP
jgi:hypothetical protein